MLEQIKNQLNNEKVQRAVLQTGAAVVTIVVSHMVSGLVAKGLNNGIDALMEKLHPIIEEVTAE